MSNFFSGWIKWLILSFLLILLVLGGVALYFFKQYTKPLILSENGEYCEVFIYPNDEFEQLKSALIANGCIANGNLLDSYVEKRGVKGSFKPGYYRFELGSSVHQVVRKVSSGNQTPVKLTFNNIRLPEQLAQRISQQLMVDSMTIDSLLRDEVFLATYRMSPETVLAMFIPNTYEVYWTMSGEKLFERMQREYQKFWNEERLSKAKAMGLTPIEVSILASIVEEESNKNFEKPTIAGLYMNRLKRGIPLQSDPTVRYAVGDFGLHRILYKHLEVESPYNTYKYAGLPPGPIAMPTIVGLDAVLNHEKHNYIYMCAKESLNGEHNFAVTLAEHNRNASKYHVALREWERKNRKR